MALIPWTPAGGFISAGEFKYLFAFIPKADLVAAGCEIDALPLGRTVSALAGAGAPLASALRTLAMHASRAEGREELALALPALSRFVIDVFATSTQSHIIRSAPEDRIDHIRSYLEDHFGLRGLTARQTAMACGLSIRQLFRAFSDVGMNFAEELRTMRLERACELLAFQPQLPIAEVAATTGFSSPSHFTRTFRTCFGTTPLQYRRRQRSYQNPEHA
jgi:AraC family transcriptional activator of tynA and feaB